MLQWIRPSDGLTRRGKIRVIAFFVDQLRQYIYKAEQFHFNYYQIINHI